MKSTFDGATMAMGGMRILHIEVGSLQGVGIQSHLYM